MKQVRQNQYLGKRFEVGRKKLHKLGQLSS